MTTMTLEQVRDWHRALAGENAARRALCSPDGERWELWNDEFLKHSAIADAIDAHLAKGAQWQPIETAPRDGTEIFLWQSDHTVPVVAHWYWVGDRELMQGCWVANKSFYSAEHSMVEDDTDTKYVTHWMPLPATPMLSQRGEVKGG